MAERRAEKRLRYNWPIWFAEDFNGVLTQGQMVDVSSSGAAFTCYADKCPDNGEHITARFSVPRYEDDSAFDLENCIRHGQICRVDHVSDYVRRVAVQFAEPLDFKPVDESESEDSVVEDTPTLSGAF